MQLNKKKVLASKVLGVGKERVVFSKEHLAEIKEAITRQDIADLHNSGIISIKQVRGRKKVVRRKNRRRTGKVKKKVNKSKQEYSAQTRRLRSTLKSLLRLGKIDKEKYSEGRKMIRAQRFKSRRHLKEGLEI